MSLNSYDVTLPEKQVLGSYAATMDNLRTALDLMATGKVDPLPWVQRFPIERGVEAFDRMLAARGDDIKAVITPS
jgi:threonine dehydrogenase-like Zn-dependent dehydrogenase